MPWGCPVQGGGGPFSFTFAGVGTTGRDGAGICQLDFSDGLMGGGVSAGPGDTLQIQSCAQEAPPRLLVSLTELKGKLRPGDETSSPSSILGQRQGQHLNKGLQTARPMPFLPHRALLPPLGMGRGWEGKEKGREWADKSKHGGKCVWGRGCLVCPRPRLGSLSNVHSLPVPDLWVSGAGGCRTRV